MAYRYVYSSVNVVKHALTSPKAQFSFCYSKTYSSKCSHYFLFLLPSTIANDVKEHFRQALFSCEKE